MGNGECRVGRNREILRLAVPAIFNNITVPLLGLCDTAIAGHLGAASYLAAMAVGTMMLNVIFWLSGFLRMGTTGLISQSFGAGNMEAIRETLRKAFIIAAAISVLVLALQRPLELLLFRIIAPDNGVADLASLYFRIVIWGAPAQLVIMVVSGWFIGMQNTFIPMVIAVGVNIVNILLSVLLVFVFDCGFAGIAFGTLAANWAGCAGALTLMARYSRHTRTRADAWKELHLGTQADAGKGESESSLNNQNSSLQNQGLTLNINQWRRFFSVNTDLFFRSACIMIVTLAMVSFGSRLGETILAANTVMMQFFMFFSYFMDGFAFAGEALTGKAQGAGDRPLLRSTVKALLLWGAGMAAAFFVIYAAGMTPIAGLLTDNQSVRDIVGSMYWLVVVLPPVTVAAFIFDGVFIGLTRTRILFFTTLFAALVYFGIVALTGGFAPDGGFDNTWLWVAFETYLLMRGGLLGVAYFRKSRS